LPDGFLITVQKEVEVGGMNRECNGPILIFKMTHTNGSTCFPFFTVVVRDRDTVLYM
jgi:hypothetical protein